MIRRAVHAAVIVVALLATGARSGTAQTGIVTGQVLDHTNKVGLDGVIVTILGTDIVAASDREGRFTIPGVPVGVRELEARRPGYISFRLPLIRVAETIPARVVFSMALETIIAIDVSWTTNASRYRGQEGQTFTYRCPPGGTPQDVWGTDLYTDDSSVCSAAVHAGKISLAEGGLVVFEMRPGVESFAPSTRNGITSSPYAAWEGAFVVR